MKENWNAPGNGRVNSSGNLIGPLRDNRFDHEEKYMNFPQFVSFTVTNACNLRCRMCGQWSDQGYILNRVKSESPAMQLQDWIRLTDEIAEYPIRFILIRGGEPFLFPGIIDLIRHINRKGLFVSIDTNGTLLGKYVEELAAIGNMHITFSVDGPEAVHDAVRGVKGSFRKARESIALLNQVEKDTGKKISKSICFTISPYNYQSLGMMPDVARSLGIGSMNIVPYYYFSEDTGKKYVQELKDHFNCPAFSWKGFHHDHSGIDFNIFRLEHQKYLKGLKGVEDFPYMPLSMEEYETWFGDSRTPVGPQTCHNVERLIDIQPDGNANFCVDFPDVSIGNVFESTIGEIWNGSRAQQFRDYRREYPLAVCFRCGGKYISEIKE